MGAWAPPDEPAVWRPTITEPLVEVSLAQAVVGHHSCEGDDAPVELGTVTVSGVDDPNAREAFSVSRAVAGVHAGLLRDVIMPSARTAAVVKDRHRIWETQLGAISGQESRTYTSAALLHLRWQLTGFVAVLG